MPDADSINITGLLHRWAQGDANALTELAPLVYQELQRIARQHLRAERAGHTLQSTALVNEAFLRLLAHQPGQLQNRGHFVAVASRLMRQILVDYARTRRARKRDGGLRLDLSALAGTADMSDAQLVALDEALESLMRLDERQARVVDMKFFGGLSTAEIAAVLEVSSATVERDWTTARIWLHRQMRES
jgi:RNA polymerase sigma-70 factor (ECF subfamily)